MGGPATRRALLVLFLSALSVSVLAAGKTGKSPAVKLRSSSVAWRRIVPDRAQGAGEIVFAAVGDIMLGSSYPETPPPVLPPHDGRDLLKQVTPILSGADITFGNLEGPLFEGGSTRSKCKQKDPEFCQFFRMPVGYAATLKAAGFNVMSVANNHALDFGEAGQVSTRCALDSVGIAHSGKIGDIARLQVKGRKIDVIAFSASAGHYSLLRLDRAAEAVRQAAQEADLVIVSFHGGGEGAAYQRIPFDNETFLSEKRGDVVRFAHVMIDAGAHLVFGHGPHVVRGMEFYRGRLIAYSLGNFATFSGISVAGREGLSLILEVHLGLDGAFRSARVYPVKQQYRSGPHLDLTKRVLPIVRELSASQFGDRAAVIADSGELAQNGPPCLPEIFCLR